MATLDQLRSLFPDAQSDSDVIKKAATEFGIDPMDIASELGVKISSPGMWTSVKRGIGQVESALGSTARDLGADRAGRALESYGEDVTFRNPAAVNTVGEALSSPWQTAKEAVGELVPQVGFSGATALGGRAIGGALGAPLGPAGVIAGQAIGGSAGAYLGNLAQEYGGIRAEQRESGREDKTRALATGAAAATLDTAFGAERLVNKVGNKGLNILSREAGKDLAPHVLKQTGLGIAGEAGTETVQTALERTGAFKDLASDDALNEYGMAAIKGGIGGGAIRGGMSLFAGQRQADAGSNDVSQAFTQKDITQPDITTQQFQAPAAPAPAMREQITEDGEIIQVPVAQTQQAPAVAGGSTEIAQAQQQAQQQAAQQQAQAQQAQAADQAAQQFGVVDPATPAVGSAFGQKVYGPNIPAVANAIASFTAKMPPQQVQLAQAITKANAETGGQLIKFKFNANDVMASVDKGFQAVGKVANRFQIAHVESIDEAAAILDDQSTQLKGDKLEQVNAIHQALTGQDTTGYQAEQLAKGAKDDKLQLQNNAGLREVPVSGGATEAIVGGDGGVRPTQVQPVGTTSVGAGPSDVQAGQLPAGGVRTSTGDVSNVGGGQAPSSQVSRAANVQATQGNDGGREPGQPKQADNAQVDSQGVRNGPRRYAEPPSYYATDLAHIKGERRIEIIKQLFAAALAPKTARKNTVPAETRAEFLRLALMEQLPHKTIAELTGVKLDTVEKQLERMGVVLVDGQFEMTDPTVAQSFVAAAVDYRSPEFPDGLGEAEVLALYTTRYEADEVEGQTLAEEIQAGEQEGKPQAKLAEELYSKDSADTQTMGTISSAGGSQGAVEATDDAFFAKVGKLQAMLDITPETDEAGRANLAKQIEAQWVQYAKKQATRAETGEVEVAPTEDEDAIQEPSAEEVPVRKRAKGGKAVGKGNAEGGQVAAEGEAKVEPKQEEVIKTPQEQWVDLSAQFPDMPPYEALDKVERDRWDDLAKRGVANLAAANQVLENGPTLKSMSAPSQFMEFDDLESQLGGMDLVREQFEEAGIPQAVDLVTDWEIIDDDSENAAHGSLRTVQGRYVGTLNIAKLDDAGYAAETARHEIAHAIDMGPHGGIYSAQPEMGVSVVNGKIKAEGPVAKELFGLYQSDAKWNDFLAYPFDSAKHPELNNRTKVQLELFAQAFSIYTTPQGRAIMEKYAPVTAAYFKEVIQDVKSTKPVQIQKVEVAAKRAAVLYTRREPKGDRGPAQVLGLDERIDELLASRSKKSDLNQPAGVFSKAGEWLDAAITSPKETLHKLKLGFLTLDQLAELDKSPGQVVRAYSDVMTAMQKTSKDLVYKAAQIDQLWAKLSQKDSDNVSQVMRDSTRAKFDPSLGVAGKNQTEQDIMDAYRALPSSAKDVYAKVKKYYEDAFATRLAIMEESAAKLGGKELKEIQELYSKLKGPYFPLGRTGRYYAVGMSPRVAELTAKKEDSGLSSSEATELAALRKQADQYKTSSYNTLYEAKKAAEEFKKSMGDSYYNEVEENIESAMSKMPNFAKLEESITTKLGGETRAEVKSMLSQLMFDSLPEHHALKNQMRREGIYGENEDMRQVFAQTSISQAHYISRLQFGGELNQAMLNVAKSARKDIEMRQIQNELKLRTKLSMDNTQSALTDSMVNASYFAHLGLSPAFLLTNMTQVPMITAPWLGARHGVGATKRAMAMALADTAKIIKSTYKDGDWRSELNWNSLFPEGSNEDRMFRDLLDRNVLDITMEHDLAAVASAQKGIFDDKISKATGGKLGGMSDVVKLVNTPVRITELANRAVTALSAYRMKMEALATAPMTPEERHTASVNYAARAVSETQLNYSELNAPRHMRQVFGSKPLAKMIFQFRKYQQGMLYLIAKNISDALPNSNATKEDRRIARRTIAGLYATTGLMAGTTGMPLMGTVGLAGIANLIAAAFGDEDEPWDFEVEYRNFLTDWLGKDMALLVAKGLPAYLGADLSKRVGMGDIANPIPFVQRGQTGQSTVANVLYAAGGAPIGMVGTMYDGIVAMANGDVMKGMEKVIPVKAVKDALRTYRYADEGMTDKRGNVILSPEKFDAWDLTLRGMGFTPTKESEYYAANAAMQEAKTAATDVRTRLLREYSEAKLKGESTEDIDAKIVDFNSRHPEKTVKIDYSTKLKAVQARRKMAAERNEAGLRIGKNEKPFADEARFATQE